MTGRDLVLSFISVLTLAAIGCSQAEAPSAPEGAARKPLVDELVAILEADGDAAELAAGSLAAMGPEAAPAIPALIKATQSTNPRTRVAAAIALFNVDSTNEETVQRVVAVVVRALTDDDADVQREALRLLSRSRRADDEQIRAIAKALVHADDYVSAHAAEALVKLGPRSVPILIEAAKDPRSVLWAILALEDLGAESKSAQSTLLETAKDEDPLIRQESALALARIQADADAAVPALIAMLDDEQAMVRAAAAHALVSYGEAARDAVAPLRRMLEGPDPLSRIIAALALIELDRPAGDAVQPIVEVLTEGLADEHPIARRESAAGLGKLGAAARSAKEKLESLAKTDPDDSVRRAAAAAAERASE
jgi:HEAT repeat protein